MTAFLIITGAHPAERHLRRGGVRDRRRSTRVDRRARGARQPSGQGRAGGAARSDAPGSLHRDRTTRHHGREPRPRHVRRARARRLDLPGASTAPARRRGSCRTASRASSRSPSSPTFTSSSARWCRSLWRFSRPRRWRSGSRRRCCGSRRWSSRSSSASTASATCCCGCSASIARRRAPSSTTRRRSCSSSSRRARSWGRSAPSPARCCRCCSSSPT